MSKHFGTPVFGTLAILTAGLLPAHSAAFGQSISSFAEPSAHTFYLASAEEAVSSSSSFRNTDAFVEAPEPAGDKTLGMGIMRSGTAAASTSSTRPFSAVAVALKIGSGGLGFDVATPLARRFNLRTGASFFSYNNANFTQDGINISGTVKLQNASAGIDIFPFNNAFRISPGLTFRNNNALSATLMVPGGQSFSLGDSDYTSDPADPIHGTAAFNFGASNLAPRLTMGFGNMLPRNGRRFSFPVEVGFEYIAQPTVALNFSGSGCSSVAQVDGTTVYGCGPVDPVSVAQEQSQLQSDLSPLRFFPIVSFGVSMRIGHISKTQ